MRVSKPSQTMVAYTDAEYLDQMYHHPGASLSVDSDFEVQDSEDLADSMGEEGRFFIENGVLTEYDIED